ncbi:SDR family oxidoreductase [Pseudonocardia sp. TRM90224]|uniref:SDR family oxidoreductase n=1 Tax=Pseudonocardia sp. TRM90224 TaxID=2812678 RepID=UPI001E514D17|nr:NAD(P)H-binding protein [Pseudonocardia sp. TRM90224]
MILVTSATGRVGGELVAQLLDAGETVRAFTRDPERAAQVLPGGVEIAGGDLATGDGVAAAAQGVRGVFLFLDATRGPSGGAGPAAELLAGAGVERVVALSSASAAGDPTNMIAGWHIAAEAAVAAAGLAATVLRPGEFMSNALEWAQQLRAGGVVRIPFSDEPGAPIDPADIASVAAVALREPGLAGRVLDLSGGEYTSPRQRAATLAGVLGREIVVEDVPEAEYIERMSGYLPPVVVEAVLDLLRQARAKGGGAQDWLWPTVRDVTGRAPRTFEDWATAHAAAFT